MKRIAAIAMSILFMMSFSACANTNAQPESVGTAIASEDTGAQSDTTTGFDDSGEEALPEGPDEQINLTLGVSSFDMPGNSYTESVVQYNNSQDHIHVEFVDYGEDNTKLYLAITAGDGPDMLMGIGDAGILTSQGALIDFLPYFEEDPDVSMDDFTNLDLLKFGNQLTRISIGYIVNSFIGLRDTYGMQKTWTLHDFLSKIKAVDRVQNVTGNLTSTSFLSSLLASYVEDHVDYQGMTCDFQTETFYTMLKAAKEIGFIDSDPSTLESADTYAALFRNYPDLIYPCYIAGVSGFAQLINQLGGTDVVFLGYPHDSGNGAMISFVPSLSAYSNTLHPDGVWEFVKYLLTSEITQNSSKDRFPVLTEALNEQIDDDDSDSSIDAAIINPQDIMQAEAAGESLHLSIGDNEVQLLHELVFNNPMLMEYKEELTKIVLEEAEAFIQDDRNAEDTAAIIQSRIQIYLGEQG